MRVQTWNEMAEMANEHIRKGSQVWPLLRDQAILCDVQIVLTATHAVQCMRTMVCHLPWRLSLTGHPACAHNGVIWISLQVQVHGMLSQQAWISKTSQKPVKRMLVVADDIALVRRPPHLEEESSVEEATSPDSVAEYTSTNSDSEPVEQPPKQEGRPEVSM
jgi:hypothetical protein